MELSFLLEASLGRFVTALFIFVRFSGVLLVAPLISSHAVPPQVRGGLAAILSLTLCSLYPPAHPAGLEILAVGLMKEALLGLILGWIASVLFSAVQMVGEWLDLSSGLQAAQLFNPMFAGGGGPFSQLKYAMAGVALMSTNGHVAVLQAAAESFRVSPPGTLAFGVGSSANWIGLIGSTIWVAIRLAAPVAVALFLAEAALALLNRAMPQLNVLNTGMSLKTMLALLTLISVLPALSAALAGEFSTYGAVLAAALRWMKP